MSIRHKYDASYSPPAPLLPIRVSSPGGETSILLPALVDSGADLCVVPETVATGLGLPLIGPVIVQGAGQARRRASLHAAEIEIDGAKEVAEVLALGEETLLGRNFLNVFVVVLDGPRGVVEISPPGPVGRGRRPTS